jgi:hypothetical protein
MGVLDGAQRVLFGALERSGAMVTEIKASHAVYISHAKEVARVMESAARAVKCRFFLITVPRAPLPAT